MEQIVYLDRGSGKSRGQINNTPHSYGMRQAGANSHTSDEGLLILVLMKFTRFLSKDKSETLSSMSVPKDFTKI